MFPILVKISHKTMHKRCQILQFSDFNDKEKRKVNVITSKMTGARSEMSQHLHGQ